MLETNNAIVYSWLRMEALHRQIAHSIQTSSFMPDCIIGISRCGLVPATHLAYLLGVDNLYIIKARTTPDDEILTKKIITPIIQCQFSPSDIYNNRVLLVDTVMASGTTINLCIDKIAEYSPIELRTAIAIDWPNSPYDLKYGEQRPSINYCGESANLWPDFPWEH